MKKNIHPNWVESQVICSCGQSFTTRSVKPQLKIEVCSRCHPFFTGQQRIVDTAGRVERFMQRVAARQEETKRPAGKRTRRREGRAGQRDFVGVGQDVEDIGTTEGESEGEE